MKFYLISKSDYSKYESSKSTDSCDKAFVATKKAESTKCETTKKSNKDYFRQRRQLKRRIKQVVQRYIKRAFIQRKNWSLFA